MIYDGCYRLCNKCRWSLKERKHKFYTTFTAEVGPYAGGSEPSQRELLHIIVASTTVTDSCFVYGRVLRAQILPLVTGDVCPSLSQKKKTFDL